MYLRILCTACRISVGQNEYLKQAEKLQLSDKGFFVVAVVNYSRSSSHSSI